MLIGGVGYRWHGDGSFGLVVSDLLARESWPPGIEVADLGYGALYVAMDLQDAEPPYGGLVLITAVERGRTPGQLFYYRWQPTRASDDEVQARIREAGAGVIDVDHVLVVAEHFDALPAEVVLVELEPVETTGDGLSETATAMLPRALDYVRITALASVAVGPD